MTFLLRVNYRFYISLFICMATAPGTLSYILPSQMFKDSGVGSRQARLSIADWSSYNYREPEGSGTYAFGYDVDDAPTGNTQFREEERHTNGTVTGSYGYVDPFGITQIVRYVADEKGYRAKTESVRKNYVATFKDPARPNIERNNYLARPYQAPSSQPYYTPQGVYVNPVYPGNQQPYYNNNYRNFG